MNRHVDPIAHLRRYDWSRAFHIGCALALENARRGKDPDQLDVVWELLREAVKTSAIAYTAPPRSGLPKKSAMPEAVDDITYWQKMTAFIRGEIDEQPEMETRPPQPSAAQVTRSEVFLEVWHRAVFNSRGDWRRMKKAVYLKANGVKDMKVRAVTGFSKQRIHAAKREAMDDMLRFIEEIRKNE